MAEEPRRITQRTGYTKETGPEPDPNYQPGFLAGTLKDMTGISLVPTVGPMKPSEKRMMSLRVWSDSQQKMVSAMEYLRETDHIETMVAHDIADTAAKGELKMLKRRVPWADPVARSRDIAINATIGKIPVAGKVLGAFTSKVAGVDVTPMGDATAEGNERKKYDEARAEYDKLAIHFKRKEVQSAVRGEKYEPNFLMNIDHVRKVTDGFQDFSEFYGRDDSLAFMDKSENAGPNSEAMWMRKKTGDKSFTGRMAGGPVGAAVNYEKKQLPLA